MARGNTVYAWRTGFLARSMYFDEQNVSKVKVSVYEEEVRISSSSAMCNLSVLWPGGWHAWSQRQKPDTYLLKANFVRVINGSPNELKMA